MTNKLEAAARQALEALENFDYWLKRNTYIAGTGYEAAITALQEALAEPQITTPDVCGEVCARAKLCYGCSKDIEEANANYVEQAEQEPVGTAGELFTMSALERLDVRPSTKVYLDAAPVRTKDLTDEFIYGLADSLETFDEDAQRWILDSNTFARAVIAADREKNK